jgi:DNA transformation protein
MGTRGAKARNPGSEAAATTIELLKPIGDVRSKSMFGGYGIFQEDVMFGIVDSEGRLYLRADPTTAPDFEAAGSTQHARMPYWEVPTSIRDDPDRLREWATTAAEVAGRGKR